jgi:hypothetical protein
MVCIGASLVLSNPSVNNTSVPYATSPAEKSEFIG